MFFFLLFLLFNSLKFDNYKITWGIKLFLISRDFSNYVILKNRVLIWNNLLCDLYILITWFHHVTCDIFFFSRMAIYSFSNQTSRSIESFQFPKNCQFCHRGSHKIGDIYNKVHNNWWWDVLIFHRWLPISTNID